MSHSLQFQGVVCRFLSRVTVCAHMWHLCALTTVSGEENSDGKCLSESLIQLETKDDFLAGFDVYMGLLNFVINFLMNDLLRSKSDAFLPCFYKKYVIRI